jgi:hypothetical protein
MYQAAGYVVQCIHRQLLRPDAAKASNQVRLRCRSRTGYRSTHYRHSQDAVIIGIYKMLTQVPHYEMQACRRAEPVAVEGFLQIFNPAGEVKHIQNSGSEPALHIVRASTHCEHLVTSRKGVSLFCRIEIRIPSACITGPCALPWVGH